MVRRFCSRPLGVGRFFFAQASAASGVLKVPSGTVFLSDVFLARS
jgi:hypothetical protein